MSTNFDPSHPPPLLILRVIRGFGRFITNMRQLAYVSLVIILSSTGYPQQRESQQLFGELPTCSILRENLDTQHGDGVDQPYMAAMRAQGLKRALIQVQAAYEKGKAEDIRVVRRLYFSQFDGPNSQISDKATLDAIAESGLQAELDKIVLGKIATAKIAGRVDPQLFPFHRVSTVAQIYASAWLPQNDPMLSPSGRTTPLLEAVVLGDSSGTQEVLRSHRFTRKELDRAMLDAALSQFDNTASIGVLLQAGANVNARAPDGTTPLMIAISRPCNLKPLLDGGADLNARDKWGRTALQRARETKTTSAIKLLEQAGAVE